MRVYSLNSTTNCQPLKCQPLKFGSNAGGKGEPETKVPCCDERNDYAQKYDLACRIIALQRKQIQALANKQKND